MIAAEPVKEENLYEWHANLMGPAESNYEDVTFHFVIKIPREYPRRAPKVEIQSFFNHPNVFGKWICLDMLEGQWYPDDYRTQTKKDVGYGWTPAYSIQSILVQLQAFLFDQVDNSWYARNYCSFYKGNSTTLKARMQAKQFRCKGCPHTGSHPWPEPLAFQDRLRYLVPSREHVDVARTKADFYRFIDNIKDELTRNKWRRMQPLNAGSFFGRTLLPWYDHRNNTDYDARLILNSLSSKNPSFNPAEAKRIEKLRKERAGWKEMDKKRKRVIEGMVRRAEKYYYSRPPPLKSVYVEKMYRIECAIDCAVNSRYQTAATMRKRGHWQWVLDGEGMKSMLSEEDQNGLCSDFFVLDWLIHFL